MRKVNADMLQARLVDGEIALVSLLGYSPTGEIFNLTVEDVAAAVAVALRADKLIFLLEGPGIANAKGQPLRELTVSDAEKLLARLTRLAIDVQLYLPPAIAAVKNGVRRAHFLDCDRECAPLLELFSQEGVRSMLTQDPLETLRPARIEDVGVILLLIEPLEREGVLAERGRWSIEREIGHFFVVEHDGIITAAARSIRFRNPARRSSPASPCSPAAATRVSASVCSNSSRTRHAGAASTGSCAHDARNALVHRARLRRGGVDELPRRSRRSEQSATQPEGAHQVAQGGQEETAR
ncbi:MAG: hypothetical protein U1E63_01680 [Burkholderiales bacterium]